MRSKAKFGLPSEGHYWPQPRSFEFPLLNSMSVWGAGITQQFSASHVKDSLTSSFGSCKPCMSLPTHSVSFSQISPEES